MHLVEGKPYMGFTCREEDQFDSWYNTQWNSMARGKSAQRTWVLTGLLTCTLAALVTMHLYAAVYLPRQEEVRRVAKAKAQVQIWTLDRKKRLAHPNVYHVWEHLQGFTGLSDSELTRRLKIGTNSYEEPLLYTRGQLAKQPALAWFNTTSLGFLFASAMTIPRAKAFHLTSLDGPVLDCNAGVGNTAIMLAKEGVKSVFVGTGVLEQAFAEYRLRKMRLLQWVTFLPPQHDTLLNHLARIPSDTYGTILAMDALQNLEKGRVKFTVQAMVESLRPGGQIFECLSDATDVGEKGMAEAMGSRMKREGPVELVAAERGGECAVAWRRAVSRQPRHARSNLHTRMP